MRRIASVIMLLLSLLVGQTTIGLGQDAIQIPEIGPALLAKAIARHGDPKQKQLLEELIAAAKRYDDRFTAFRLQCSIKSTTFSPANLLIRTGAAECLSTKGGAYFKSSMEVSVDEKASVKVPEMLVRNQKFTTIYTPESWWQLNSSAYGQLNEFPPVKGVLSPPWKSRVARRRNPKEARKELLMGSIFNPNTLFELDQGGRPAAFLEMLFAVYDDARMNTPQGGLLLIEETQFEGRPAVQILYALGEHTSPQSDLGMLIVMDRQQGCPYALINSNQGVLNLTKQWRYVFHGDSAVPESLRMTIFDPQGLPLGMRELTKMVFDFEPESIPFDETSLDFEFSDRLVDEFQNRLYVFNGEKLVPVEDFDYSLVQSEKAASPLQGGWAAQTKLVIGIVLCLAAIAAFLVIRKRMQS